MRLFGRMKNNFVDIIAREEKEASKIFLYEEDGYWCAYEKSAILISKMLKGAVTITDHVTNGSLILNKVKVDLDSLVALNITSCSDNELIISCTEYGGLKS